MEKNWRHREKTQRTRRDPTQTLPENVDSSQSERFHEEGDEVGYGS